MLPFLRPKKAVAAPQVVNMSKNSHNNEQNHGLLACAHELIHAQSFKDAEGIAKALRAAFEILSSETSNELDRYE